MKLDFIKTSLDSCPTALEETAAMDIPKEVELSLSIGFLFKLWLCLSKGMQTAFSNILYSKINRL